MPEDKKDQETNIMDSFIENLDKFARRELGNLKSSWEAFLEDAIARKYVKQLELAGIKTEGNAVTSAVHGVNSELTMVKFEHTFFDPIQAAKDKAAETAARAVRQHPEQLRHDIDDLRGTVTTIDRRSNDAKNTAARAHTRITQLAAEVRPKLRAMTAQANVGQENAQRQSAQLRGLQQAASRANNEVRRLYGEIARLDARL